MLGRHRKPFEIVMNKEWYSKGDIISQGYASYFWGWFKIDYFYGIVGTYKIDTADGSQTRFNVKCTRKDYYLWGTKIYTKVIQ